MKEAPEHLIKEPKYGFELLVGLLVATLIIPSYIEADTTRSVVTSLLLSFTLISSLYLVVYQPHELYIGIGLMVPCLLNLWWNPPFPEPWDQAIGYTLYIAFTAYILWHIGRYLVETDQISLDMVLASVCVYFLLGLLWAFIYLMIELLSPGAFYYPETPGNVLDYNETFIYFSYVTLTTLGYGEMTPVSQVARSWSVMESMVGQLYLTIVIARLVGLGITSRRDKKKKDSF